jgi:peptide/nickel transport system permease protein
MVKYILKRLGMAVFVLLGVSLIIYFLIRLMPVSFIENKVAEMKNSNSIPQEVVDMLYKEYNLTPNPTFKDIIGGYWNWLKGIATLDFGTSFAQPGNKVMDIITSKMGVSFTVSFIAVIFEFLIAIPLGITAATHQYSIRDYILTVFVMVGISLPTFFFGNMLIELFSVKLGWFPTGGMHTVTRAETTTIGYLLDYLRCMTLPVLTLVILSLGGRMRMTRTNMLEVLNSDYIRTARAKGLKEYKVIYKHAFRNTMIPIVTGLAGLIPHLFSGAMITEAVFDLPGIGSYALKAMTQGDIPVIMTYNMFLAALAVLGVLMSDLMYGIVDPRVKLA